MRFFRDLQKYWNYANYSAWAELKNQVHGSYLGWMWWVLDPLLYMLVYSFIVEVVFDATVENLPLFVFVGLTAWNFFAATVQSSVGCIRSYRSVLQKSYLPKFILVLLIELANFYKLLIGLGLSFAAMIFLGIPIHLTAFNLLPLIAVYFILVFGASLVCAHIGVYVVDFQNVVIVLVRLLFYLSGVFYTLDRLPVRLLTVYNRICPTGFLIKQFREALMYGRGAYWQMLFYWFLVACALSVFGLGVTYAHENNYMKVI
jgi:ABC-type polysaccharide/polyol phosphate export permease